jgi:drug/metabolite transporter (DMT)-like permease
VARIVSVALLAMAAVARRERVTLRGRTPAALAPVLAIGLLDLTANALYAVATRHGQLAIVAVLSSLYPVATVLLARGVLRERVQRVQELGIASAIVGVVLIAAG